MLEFHDKHGRNRRKERICFDHEQVRDQNKCVLAAIASVLVMKFKALEQLIFVKIVVQPRCVVDHESLLLIFDCVIAANVYAYVHGHTRTHWPQSTQSMREVRKLYQLHL